MLVTCAQQCSRCDINRKSKFRPSFRDNACTLALSAHVCARKKWRMRIFRLVYSLASLSSHLHFTAGSRVYAELSAAAAVLLQKEFRSQVPLHCCCEAVRCYICITGNYTYLHIHLIDTVYFRVSSYSYCT